MLCPCEILVCRYSNHHCVVENCKNHQGVTVPYQDLVVVVEHLKIRYQLSILSLIRFWNRSNSVFCFSFYSAWNEGPKKKIWASKKLVTGPNGIMVAQTFCDIFFMKKNIRYLYINSFQINCFFINNIKIHSFTSLAGVGALQGNFGTCTD